MREWQALQSIAIVQSERQVGAQRTLKRRYYISSLQSNAKLLLHTVRTHWGIKHNVHSALDITCHQVGSRIRKGNNAKDYAVPRRLAPNLLKLRTSAKRGLKGKRKKAAWDEQCLLKILTG